MNTLFDETFEVKKKVGNPYHSRSGKYTDRKTAAKELAEKRADVAENKLEYITSCYVNISKQYSRLIREYEQLKTELSNYKSKTA